MVSLPKVLCRADPSRLEGNRRDHRDRRHLAIETALKGKQGRVAIAEHFDRLPALAEDLVRRHVDAIFAGDTTAAVAAKSATSTIPIVFFTGADPVALGLVASLNRPGSNLTGAGFLEVQLIAKRLELLHEIVPAVTRIGFLVNPTSPYGGRKKAQPE